MKTKFLMNLSTVAVWNTLCELRKHIKEVLSIGFQFGEKNFH